MKEEEGRTSSGGEIYGRWAVWVLGQKSGREPFYTKTHLKHFKILYLPRNFIKPKSKLLADFYFN